MKIFKWLVLLYSLLFPRFITYKLRLVKEGENKDLEESFLPIPIINILKMMLVGEEAYVEHKFFNFFGMPLLETYHLIEITKNGTVYEQD